ncbi:MAG: TGS domain-containing protein, partial [Candidatus Aenigmarchaeota archaeon]|nr:TGS domain-containing protein [Candidatus Aenigmarchaeota archaeon]MDI6722588.1 TGS domain-containing protein [Candidatus Aenigmarchaeota archaeon]
ATFQPEHMSIVRTADLLLLLAKNENELKEIEDLVKNNFIRTKSIYANPFTETVSDIKEKIWSALGMIVVFTRKTQNGKKRDSPMALPAKPMVEDFAERIHKDFVKNFHFARLWRKGMVKQVGLSYRLEHGDIVEIHAK